jgi:hypothetical protein
MEPCIRGSGRRTSGSSSTSTVGRFEKAQARRMKSLHAACCGPKAGALGYWTGHGISADGFYHAWRRSRTAAGCPGSIPHDFRRTAIRNMVRAGLPERVAMKSERPQDPQRVRSLQRRERWRLRRDASGTRVRP